MRPRFIATVRGAGLGLALLSACGSDDSSPGPSGSGAISGAAGSVGSGGSAGSAGSAGSDGAGGDTDASGGGGGRDGGTVDGAGGSGGSVGGAAGSGGRQCANADCTSYCEGNVLRYSSPIGGSTTLCPSQFGSVCEVGSGTDNTIRCSCGSVTETGVCYSQGGPWTNAGAAVWARCQYGTDLMFYVCAKGRSCGDPEPCF